MSQGLLPFKYEMENKSGGLTALGGAALYLELFKALRLGRLLDRKVRVRCGDQGYTDGQVGSLLMLLNIVGGDCVEDLERMAEDEGFCRLWAREQLSARRLRCFRWERDRVLPSASTVFRYLEAFHEEEGRVGGVACIPEANGYLRGLREVNRGLLGRIQALHPSARATLDCDATVVKTWKGSALYSYQGDKGYQPVNIFWREQELLVHTEFRDGNVPAGMDLLRLFQEGLRLLPAGVKEVRLRSDAAGYQHDLLGYCDDGKDERFGRIHFTVGCPVTNEFKKAVREITESEWQPLDMYPDGSPVPGGRQWAEVCYVPTVLSHKKRGREYRYLATRQELEEQMLPGMEEQLKLPFPVLEMARCRYKVFAVVSNLDGDGAEVIRWHDDRCGKSEEAHAILKHDLAAGKFPSGKFGANAAWWWFAVLAFNVQSAMKRLVLDEQWRTKRLKAIRFYLIHLPARVLWHANRLIIRIATGTDIFTMLLRARARIMALARAPATG